MSIRTNWRSAVAALALAIVTAACVGGTSEPSPQPTTTAPTSAPEAQAIGAGSAVALVEEYLRSYVDLIAASRQDATSLAGSIEKLAGFYGPGATLDQTALASCFESSLAAIDGRLLEHTAWIDAVDEEADGDLWRIVILDNQVVPGSTDSADFREVIVGANGILADRPLAESAGVIAPCVASSLTLDRDSAAQIAAGDWQYSAVAFAGPPTNSAGDVTVEGDDGDGDGQWPRREAFPADPADPEPIASTGSNKWDLITESDPSALACVVYLGQGPEEILASDKSAYEAVPNAHLFTAFYSDGTTIDIRIHPELGAEQAAKAEVDRYAFRLGQLPQVLRQDIRRFAVRAGSETATGSPGEGISMQTENAAIRIADDRLEETLFHEAIHTSLDSTHSYQRSQAWLDAQAADGKWLTEYGRQNPDSEDLAESALYAYALLHHPERLPEGVAEMITERIPNRIDYLKSIFPPGQATFVGTGTPTACP